LYYCFENLLHPEEAPAFLDFYLFLGLFLGHQQARILSSNGDDALERPAV
jgi:hypothetical protein